MSDCDTSEAHGEPLCAAQLAILGCEKCEAVYPVPEIMLSPTQARESMQTLISALETFTEGLREADENAHAVAQDVTEAMFGPESDDDAPGLDRDPEHLFELTITGYRRHPDASPDEPAFTTLLAASINAKHSAEAHAVIPKALAQLQHALPAVFERAEAGESDGVMTFEASVEDDEDGE